MRENSILLLDNCAYHRSGYIMEVIDKYNLPVAYLGPYSFKMAVIEKMFAYIKSRDLND